MKSESFWPSIDSNATDTFRTQKGSKDIVKIVHVTSVVQRNLWSYENTSCSERKQKQRLYSTILLFCDRTFIFGWTIPLMRRQKACSRLNTTVFSAKFWSCWSFRSRRNLFIKYETVDFIRLSFVFSLCSYRWVGSGADGFWDPVRRRVPAAAQTAPGLCCTGQAAV